MKNITFLKQLYLFNRSGWSRICMIMRLIIMLIIFTSLTVSAKSFSQKVDLSVKNVSVQDVLDLVHAQTGYSFLWNKVTFRDLPTVTISLHEDNLPTALHKLFADLPLAFDIHGNVVFIRRAKKSNIFKLDTVAAMISAFQQVKGLVLDSITGKPLVGVSVKIKGSSSGAATDENGYFNLNADKDAQLELSYVGYNTKVVNLNGRSSIKIRLSQIDSWLSELVVVGYGKQKKIDLSGSVDEISSKQLENRPVVNVGQALQGISPNLNVSIPDGSAGTAPSFNIRGMTSINGGDPLILVDNIPISSAALARMNPDDIDNISVLKDASSAAIYGARAAFGVILITTKMGKSEKVAVNVNASYATRKLARLPSDIVTDPYTNMVVKNEAGTPVYNPIFSPELLELGKKHSQDPSLSPYEVYPSNPSMWFYVGRTNWYKEAYRDYAPLFNINADVSQRGKRATYYLSVGHSTQDGIFNYGNDKYDRYNMRGKVEFQVTDWFKLGNNTTIATTKYDAPSFGGYGLHEFYYQLNHLHPLLVPKNPDGSWATDPQGWLMGGRALGLMDEGGRNVSNSRDVQTTFNADLSMIKGVWEVKADATFNRSSSLTRGTNLPMYYRKGPGLPLVPMSVNPTATNSSYFYNYDVYNVYTNYHQTFNQKHAVSAILGYNQESSRENTIATSRTNLVSNDYPTVQLATGTATVGEYITTWAVQGVFGRLNYSFDNKYLIELNGRYDGTSRFPKGDRFGFFPSASAGWVVSREKFMQGINNALHINNFKLRGSYGNLGNQNVSAYSYIAGMTAQTSRMIINGIYPTQISAPGLVSNSLTWETVSTLNGGLDLAMFNNKLDASFDIYTRRTKGMLTKGATLPNVLGATEPKENAADLKTNGWELSLSWKDQIKYVAGSPLNWSVRFTLADNRSWITKYANPNRVLSDYYVGEQIGEIWGLVTEGFFATDEEVKNHAVQTVFGSSSLNYQFYAGDLKWKDLNNDGKIDRGLSTVDNPGDLKKIGNSSPRYPFSFDIGGDWKGFDVRAFFDGIGKRDWYPAGDDQYFWGIYANPWAFIQKQNLDHWTADNQNAYWPRIKAYIARSTGYELSMPQTKYLQDASYIRLQNITVGYSWSGDRLKKAFIQGVRIYFSAENVFETSHIRANVNPATVGADPNIYPLQRTYSLGVNFKL